MKDNCLYLVLSKQYPRNGKPGIDFCHVLQKVVTCEGKMSKCEKQLIWGVKVDISKPRYPDNRQVEECYNE